MIAIMLIIMGLSIFVFSLLAYLWVQCGHRNTPYQEPAYFELSFKQVALTLMTLGLLSLTNYILYVAG